MHQGICELSIIPIRAEPDSKSELITQLLFGETYNVKEQQGEWFKIETTSENYTGWLNQNQFCELTIIETELWILKKFPLSEAIHQGNGSHIYLLPGSVLYRFEPTVKGAFFYLNHDKFFSAIETTDVQQLVEPGIEACALQFLNSPYLWGGKSMWGMDCSGFSQIVFKVMNIQLPRDAWQQAEIGEIVTFSNQVKVGDLAFFENENGKIIHVGIMLKPDEIIHASGKVRVDVLDSFGIYNLSLRIHTHKLRFIKRILK